MGLPHFPLSSAAELGERATMRVRVRVCSLLGSILPLLLAAAGAVPTFPAVDPTYLDRRVAPCADFYAFANGAFAAAEIPGDQRAWGVNEEINERNNALLRDILETAAREGGPPGSVGQRLGDFYASGMDGAAIAAAGLDPIGPMLAEIAAIRTAAELPAALGRLHRAGLDAGFAFFVTIDDKDSSAMIARLDQGGCGLPERSYYFEASPEAQRIRTAYVAYLTRLLTLAGEPADTAASTGTAIMALETRLAAASRSLEALQDPQTNYHKFRVVDLAAGVGALDWASYFATIGFPGAETTVLVGQPEFFSRLAETMTTTPLATWRAYLRVRLLDGAAACLGPEYERAQFEFDRTLSGAPEMEPRWRRVLAAIDAGIGEDLGQRYVQRAFSPAAKDEALRMLRFALAAMRIRIARADWMSPATKAEATRKLDTMRLKVGYPDAWRDYRALAITRQSYAANVLAAQAFDFRRRMNQLGQPVDREEWSMTPQTNNAYYDASRNEMVFPAGILQPPFFDVRADAASNYGATGFTIGHELTHGFDNGGRRYDADGNLRDWWTPEDAANYDRRADGIVRQYNALEVLPGIHLNGRQTLDENIADIGGVVIAFDAFHLATAGMPAAPIDGFTADQRFFIAYAQGWRTNLRPEWLRFLVTADTHSTPRERVNAVLADIGAFYRAFACPAPDNLPPPIW